MEEKIWELEKYIQEIEKQAWVNEMNSDEDKLKLQEQRRLIDSLEKQKSSIEDEILSLWSSLDDKLNELKQKESKWMKDADLKEKERMQAEAEKRREISKLREELEQAKDEIRALQTWIVTYKANEESLEEKARLQDKRFFELEKSHENRMKAYEEQIYALTQEIKMRKRENEKLEVLKSDLEQWLAKALASEKQVLQQLHESSNAYSDCLKKYESLEERTSNLRAELVRLTRERNDAEADLTKSKLKYKV